MPGYQLTGKALRETFSILEGLRRGGTPESAKTVEDLLFTTFDRLGARTAIGHRRPDITDKNLLFYTSNPYMIVFRKRNAVMQILHIVYGSRDLRKLL